MYDRYWVCALLQLTSGVTSLGLKPVPPVVRTRLRPALSAQSNKVAYYIVH